MPKPACPKCQRFFRPKTNGYSMMEGMPLNNAPPGKVDPDNWKPYKLWVADLWECPDCGAEVVVGYGQQPVAEHYQTDFREQVALRPPKVQINDC